MTNTLPLIGLASDARQVGGYNVHGAIDLYARAIVAGSEGIPVIIPSLGADIDFDALMGRLNGLLFPGARSNVHPSEYNDPEAPDTGPHDQERDATSLPMIRAALRHGVPLFAICRGIQELNVALGGTLMANLQDKPGRDDHRSDPELELDARFALRQEVDIRPGGILAEIFGQTRVTVNTLHTQAIDRLAEDLAIEATADDGTIEAVHVRNTASFAIGVQWHPEYWVRTDAPSQKLFTAFGHAARAHMKKRSG